MDAASKPNKEKVPTSPVQSWQRQSKSVPQPIKKWRGLVLLMTVLVVGALAAWGYLAFDLIYGSYVEAITPSVEQLEVYRLQIDEAEFNKVKSEIEQRNLY